LTAASNAGPSKGFRKKTLMALGSGALLGCGFVARRNENDRQVRTRISCQPMQFEAIDARHSDIGDQAIDLGQNVVFEERLSGGKRANRMSRRLEEILDRLENSNVIVNNGRFWIYKNPSFRNHSCMPTTGYWYFQLLGNPDEIGQRRGFHLLHNPAAVDLKRHLTDSEFRRGLLVQQATGNQRQNFAFTGGQAAKALLQLG
jgi:hypothetical protein